ncbi:MAG TPA: ADP-ribosylglycohydrolase family protein [Nitrosospira sp.]|nr:ADP-ribosylglycohydrolase family protein [Nitrosospira sp.]
MAKNSAAILGALVADAASLGLHWLYDPDRISRIAADRGLVFLQPDMDDYSGAKGYFAHGGKTAGDSSSYGETCLLMLAHLARHGGFNRVAYQAEFRSHFGPGGAYIGYVDTPMRATLHTLLPLEPAAFPAESGADDDQHLALAALPALVAFHEGSQDSLMDRVEEVVRITNNNALAVAAGQCAAAALFNMLRGEPAAQALANALPFAGSTLRPLLEQALAMTMLDGIAAAQRFGSACHVAEGLPVIFHIARQAPDYRSAIESNIGAGGDSCGRSIMLGAMAAICAAGKREAGCSIPLQWLARYRKLAGAADSCAALGFGSDIY